MKPLIILLLTLLMCVVLPARAQEQQVVPYTLADRDRAIRSEITLDTKFKEVDNRFTVLEAKMDTKFDSVQKQFDNVQRQIDQLTSLFYWGFGILISLFLFNIGYTIWDRRTALKPALDKANAADYRALSAIMRKTALI